VQSNQIQGMKLPTTIGCGALAMWSLYALVVSELVSNLPVFQTLFLMFGASFIVMALRITLLKRWHLVKQPWFIWLVGVIGVCGSEVAYIMAVKYAPIAHVDFIDYLWPFLVIVLSSFLPKERLSLQHFIGGGMGFLGVFLLLTGGGDGPFGLKSDYLWGYIFALTAALIWSLYTIITRWYKEMPAEMVGMFCGIGAIISLAFHCRFETWVPPTPFETFMVGLLGISSGVAYLFWTHATQKGNLKLLSVLAYFTPIISMSLLVIFGKEPMSAALVFSCLLVVSGIAIGSINWKRLRLNFGANA
jgi:drug/metabolite transporter (DMT)-like permease